MNPIATRQNLRDKISLEHSTGCICEIIKGAYTLEIPSTVHVVPYKEGADDGHDGAGHCREDLSTLF